MYRDSWPNSPGEVPELLAAPFVDGGAAEEDRQPLQQLD